MDNIKIVIILHTLERQDIIDNDMVQED